MTSVELARMCVTVAEEKKAKDAVVVDLREHTVIADFFVIVTVNNDRHAQAVVNDVVDATKLLKRKILHRDGECRSGWAVLDLGDVIMHVFTDNMRKRYNLEDFWKRCPLLLDNR